MPDSKGLIRFTKTELFQLRYLVYLKLQEYQNYRNSLSPKDDKNAIDEAIINQKLLLSKIKEALNA